jgi:hypothetical protein
MIESELADRFAECPSLLNGANSRIVASAAAETLAVFKEPLVVGATTQPSSMTPLQLSSMPLQVASVGENGVPGEHESATRPFTHDVAPDAVQGPVPQTVGTET